MLQVLADCEDETPPQDIKSNLQIYKSWLKHKLMTWVTNSWVMTHDLFHGCPQTGKMQQVYWYIKNEFRICVCMCRCRYIHVSIKNRCRSIKRIPAASPTYINKSIILYQEWICRSIHISRMISTTAEQALPKAQSAGTCHPHQQPVICIHEEMSRVKLVMSHEFVT